MNRTSAQVFDEWLLLRGQQGDRAALEELLQRWQPRLLAHACRLLGDVDIARDVLQESLLAIARSLKQLKDPALFRAWIYRILSNKCADHIRREQRRRQVTSELMAEGPTYSESSHADHLTLEQAVASLPGQQRGLLAMFYLEGMSVQEIALALEIKSGTVKSRLFHLRKQLIQLVEGEINEICG